VGYCYWYERVIRDYYGQFYISKMYNLIAMNKFLEAQALPRWNHEEIWNLNGPISWNKFELVTKSIQWKDSPAQNNSLLRSTTHFFLERTWISLNSLIKRIRVRNCSNPIPRDQHYLTLCKTTHKGSMEKRKLLSNNLDYQACKYSQQNSHKQNSTAN
jgi:hypothetical protein